MLHYPSFTSTLYSRRSRPPQSSSSMAHPRPYGSKMSYYDEEFELLRDVCSWFYHYCNGYYFTTTACTRTNGGHGVGCCNPNRVPPTIVWLRLPVLIVNHGCIMIGEALYALWSFLTTNVPTRGPNKKTAQKNEQEQSSKWIGLLLVLSTYTSIRIVSKSVPGQTIITVLFILNQLYYNYLLFRKDDCGLLDLICSLFFGNAIVVTKIDKHIHDKVIASFHPHLIVNEGHDMSLLAITDYDIVINDDKHPGTRQWIQIIQNSSTVYKSFHWNKISRYLDKEFKHVTTDTSPSEGTATPRRRYIIKQEISSSKESLWKIAKREDIMKHAKRHFCVAQRYGMDSMDLTTTSSLRQNSSKIELQDGNSSTDVIVEDMEADGGDERDCDIEMGRSRRTPPALSKQHGVSTSNASDRSLSMTDLVIPPTNILKTSATPSETALEDEQSSQSRSYGSRISSSSASIDPKNQHSFSTLANVFDVYFDEETHYGTICWRSVIVSHILEFDTFNKEVFQSIKGKLSQDHNRSYYVKDDPADIVESAAPSTTRTFPWRKASEQEIWNHFEVAFNEERTNHQA